MLVNIFDQGDLDDPATLEALTPSHDAESGQRQAYGQMVDDVPAFPYTQTPNRQARHDVDARTQET